MLGLFSKIRMIQILIVSVSGIFMNKLVASNKIYKLSVTITELISSINLDLSLVEYLDSISVERREPRY